jgi:hypothetical protein
MAPQLQARLVLEQGELARTQALRASQVRQQVQQVQQVQQRVQSQVRQRELVQTALPQVLGVVQQVQHR